MDNTQQTQVSPEMQAMADHIAGAMGKGGAYTWAQLLAELDGFAADPNTDGTPARVAAALRQGFRNWHGE